MATATIRGGAGRSSRQRCGAALFALCGIACNDAGEAPPAKTEWFNRLEFVSDFNIPTGVSFHELAQPESFRRDAAGNGQADGPTRREGLHGKASGEFGGISALAFDAASSTLYALSDSSSPVLFALRFQVDGGSMTLAPLDVILLTDENGTPFPPWTLDPEGIALSGDGTLFVSSEGYADREPPVDPGLFEFGMDGRLKRRLSIPNAFLVADNAGSAGIRHNLGFESLTISPSGDRLYLATEGPLEQDGDPCTTDSGCVVRIIDYPLVDRSGGTPREFTYEMDAMEVPDGFDAATGGTGLVEILATGENELITLERSFAQETDPERYHLGIQIHQIRVGDAQKLLLLDLDTVVHRLTSGYRSLDNFEGMCFGPTLDGDPTIILVSDNNYNERQRTAILLLKLLAGGVNAPSD